MGILLDNEKRLSAEGVSTEYRRYLKELYELLKEFRSGNSLRFGPDYLLSTSQGQPVTVQSLFLEREMKDQQLISVYKKIVLIAFDDSGQILGHRITGFHCGDGFIEAAGNIAVAGKEAGVSSVIDLVNFEDILPREATAQGMKLFCSVENGNQRMLEQLEEQWKSIPDPEITDLIERKKVEQQRWLKQYGPGGRFGFKYPKGVVAKGERCYLPDEVIFGLTTESTSYFGHSKVNLYRFSHFDKPKREGVMWENADEVENIKQLQSSRLERFQTVLLPQIEQLLSV